MADGRLERYLRPRYVLPALGALLVFAILMTPESDVPTGDTESYLTTYRADDWGARGIHDVLQHLGVKVLRRITPLRAPLDSDAVYAVLAPPFEPSGREMSALLDAVRRGAGLVVIPQPHTVFAESLGVVQSDYEAEPLTPLSDTLFGRERADTGVTVQSLATAVQFLAGDNARTFHHFLEAPTPEDSTAARALPSDTVSLLVVRGTEAKHPAIMGRRVGRGRVVLIADPKFLRNAVMRRGDAAVLTVRLLEWAAANHALPVVFDEYHHGYGRHVNLIGTVFDGLVGSPAGRIALQVAAAALILLVAIGVRPIAPSTRVVIERRSPLEHVNAASRAYERVHATRLAARRLVRGLRRRHPLGAAGVLDDDAYLSRLRTRAPGLAADAALLAHAIRDPLPAGEFVRAGAAIDHIERTLTS